MGVGIQRIHWGIPGVDGMLWPSVGNISLFCDGDDDDDGDSRVKNV